ncbi:hypothetical protein Tco_1243798 [Tanacetum coccineum]
MQEGIVYPCYRRRNQKHFGDDVLPRPPVRPQRKIQVIEQQSEERRQLIQSQRIAEDMKVLQIDIREMDPADTVIINAQKARIRAAYPPPPPPPSN